MSEIYIKYSSLENAITCSSKVRNRIDDYSDKIGKVINKKASKLPGSDSRGYVQSAANLANQKVTQLTTKKEYFSNFEKTAQNIIDVAKSVDSTVSRKISTITESYIEDRKWYETAGDWIYNTFCIDLVNQSSLVRDLVDGIKWVNDKVGNVIENIHEWFKYGDGQYVWKIAASAVGAVAAVAGAVAAICAIPFTGGLSIPLLIGCVGALATSIGAIITLANSASSIYTSSKALSLSGNIFDDDDGSPGAARYYGSTSKMSEAFEKFDYGDEEANKKYKTAGVHTDRLKVVADTTSLVCNIASLGNVRDYRVTTRTDNINFKYNSDKWYKKGYSFTWKNIKKNLRHEMGMKVTTGEFKDGSIGLKLRSTDKVSKYTLNLPNVTLACPEKLVNFFNVTRTTDNTMSLMENINGLYDFHTESDKTFSGLVDATGNFTGIGKTSKYFSMIDKYGTKNGKNINNQIDLIFELQEE